MPIMELHCCSIIFKCLVCDFQLVNLEIGIKDMKLSFFKSKIRLKLCLKTTHTHLTPFR